MDRVAAAALCRINSCRVTVSQASSSQATKPPKINHNLAHNAESPVNAERPLSHDNGRGINQHGLAEPDGALQAVLPQCVEAWRRRADRMVVA
jgi:hypothetical protein